MKTWDLTSGAAKLELAMQSLAATVAETEEHWDDETYASFRQTYLAPLEPKVRMALDAMHTLAALLHRAERACRSESSEFR
jgi:hypothetical protein